MFREKDRTPGYSIKLDFCDVSSTLREFLPLLTPEEVVQDHLETAHPGHAGLGAHCCQRHHQGEQEAHDHRE